MNAIKRNAREFKLVTKDPKQQWIVDLCNDAVKAAAADLDVSSTSEADLALYLSALFAGDAALRKIGLGDRAVERAKVLKASRPDIESLEHVAALWGATAVMNAFGVSHGDGCVVVVPCDDDDLSFEPGVPEA